MAAVVLARWRSHGVSRGAGVEMDGTPSTQMVGTSHPLGCGSTQIGGGVDGMDGVEGLGCGSTHISLRRTIPKRTTGSRLGQTEAAWRIVSGMR